MSTPKAKKKVAKKKKPVATNKPPVIKEATIRGKIAELLGLALGPGAEEAGLALRDFIAQHRTRNWLKYHDELLPEIKRRKLSQGTLRKLPFGLSMRILEKVSLEDDDEVLKLWAKLTASALDPSAPEPNHVFVSVLQEMGRVEVMILRLLWLRRNHGEDDTTEMKAAPVKQFFKKHLAVVPMSSRTVALLNLRRQDCIRIWTDWRYLDEATFRADDGFSMGGDRDTLRELVANFEALRLVLEEVAGAHDENYLRRSVESSKRVEPELYFHLTALGDELMARCETPTGTRTK